MELIRLFGNISKDDAPIAGGKGASLGEMTQAGIPVPPGFVVLSAAFERFLEETDLNIEIDAILHKVNHKEIHTVENASETIRELILNVEMPEDIENEIHRSFKVLDTQYVAVRSSATAEDGKDHAWAGQLESYLNTTGDDVLNKVKLCWSSLFTPRAIFYRFEKGLHTTKISVAVVIQKMVASEVSGIAFSVHPVTEDHNQLIIEAGFGLGEAIVSGSVTPDSYVVSKEPRTILDINISTQDRALYRSETVSAEHGRNEWRNILEPRASSQVLTESQILELSEIILTIENHYGFPCDIEWAYEGGEFYVVQSRPITTLMHNDIAPSDTRISIPDFIHHVAFLASRPQSVQRDEAVYVFLEKWKHLGVGVVSIPLEGLNRALYAEKTSIDTIYKEVIASISTEQGLDGHLRTYEKLMVEYQEVIRVFRSVDSQKEHLKSALNLFIEACVKLTDYVWAPFTIDTDFGVLFREKLKKESGDEYESILEGVSSPTRFHEYQNMRLAMCEHVIDGDDMRQAAADLTEKYTWYGEYSYVEKLYDDEYFQAELAKLTPESAADEKEKLNADLQENVSRYNNALSEINDPTTRVYAKIINQYVFLRTDRVDSFKKLQTAFRNVFEKIAENLGKETGERWSMEEVVSMTNEEILKYLDGIAIPDKTEMTRRTHRYVYFRNPQMTRVLTEESKMNGITDIVLSSVGQDEGIKGLVAYKGVVTGRVATVFSKDDLHKVVDGSVLVARTTMVDYISAMERAVAFVTEEGGITSHAAIVARELKKPCIVGTGNCMRILKDGDLVEVDACPSSGAADNGVVRILEGEKENRSVLDGLSSQILFPEGGRACYFYAHYSILHMYSVPDKTWPLDVGGVGNFRNHLVKWYIAVKSEKEFDKYLDRFLGDPLVFDTLENFIIETRELAVEKLKVNYLELTDDELAMIAKGYYIFYETILRAAGTLRCVDRAIVSRLRSVFGSSADPDRLIRLASTSEKLSFSLKEERELLQLAIWLKKEKIAPASEEAAERIKRIHDDYCWLVRGYYNEKEKTVSDYRAILDEMIEKQPEITLADLNVKITRELEEKQRVFAVQNRSDDTLIRIASEAAYLKDYFKFSINKMAYFAEPLFAEIARRTDRTPDFIKDLYPQETRALLHGETIDISAVEERLRHNILISNKGRCYEYVGAEADQLEARYLAKDQDSKNEFKGRIASAGYGCGRAKVVLSGADFHKLEEGDVLVVMNTSPDFVPILGRAAAIVAEEGGIAAHVSVISREFGIPCVVGIPHITQILKDGDLVEVDADNGVVRIIFAQTPSFDSKLKSLVTRKYVPLISDLFIQAYADVDTYRKIFFTDYYVRVAYVSGKYCYGPESMDFGRHLYGKFKKDKDYFDRMFANIYTHGEELYDVAVSLAGRDYRNITKEDALRLTSDFFETYKTFSISLLGFCIQYPVEEQLRHIAERADSPDEALSFLSFPEKENFSALEQERLYKIGSVVVAEKASSYAALSDKAKGLLIEHANEYGWINARGGLDESWSPEDIYDRIVEIDVDFAKKYKENMEGKIEHKRESEEYLRNLDLSGEEMEIVKIAKELVYFRTYRTDYLNRIMSTAKPLLQAVAKLLNISFKDLMHLRIHEIISEDIPSKKEIENRKKGYFLATIEPNSTVFSADQKEITAFKEQYIDESAEKEGNICGTVAYKGKIRGRVTLVMKKSDFDRVIEGSILVTAMTTPDMIAIMQKAAAFVTDEGGITCHAAIIAREMNKPCIIGTKIATQVLKDGDLVEVDACPSSGAADEGMVRILEK